MSLLPYHTGNKTNFINPLFTLTRVLTPSWLEAYYTQKGDSSFRVTLSKEIYNNQFLPPWEYGIFYV